MEYALCVDTLSNPHPCYPLQITTFFRSGVEFDSDQAKASLKLLSILYKRGYPSQSNLIQSACPSIAAQIARILSNACKIHVRYFFDHEQ